VPHNPFQLRSAMVLERRHGLPGKRDGADTLRRLGLLEARSS
jgi:hypothetical protein